jgi:succinate dehydrogenase/fumarate reductase flavoprotein subunit
MTGLDLTTDALVVGGGPAATWAALKAALAGAEVVLADKGYRGTSGATASGGTGVVLGTRAHRDPRHGRTARLPGAGPRAAPPHRHGWTRPGVDPQPSP